MAVSLAARRIAFTGLVAASVCALAIWLGAILSADGSGWRNALMVALFSVKATWVLIFFWHAVIGFLLMHATGDPLRAVFPKALKARAEEPIRHRTAIVMTVRNEPPEDVFSRLRALREGLDASPWGHRFDYFVLSDSSLPEVVAAEQRLSAEERTSGRGRIVYRHRSVNSGSKHGNLMDFCDRWGAEYDLMLVLDADSQMTGRAVLRLVRIMQANPEIGILQSLLVGVLAPSAFARVFEFGHRHGMRCSMVGAVWWQAERGQYRGHNAVIRIVPFMTHCRLAEAGAATRGRSLLGHDQVEAARLHAAGYEIWELPQEDGSFEGQPPAPQDFIRRYGRWFYGNLRNLRLLHLPGLSALDRYHLIAVAHRFVAWPAFLLFVVLAAWTAATWPAGQAFPARPALALYLTYAAIYFTPRALGVVDAFISFPQGYGGRARLLAGALVEAVLTVLFVPMAMVGTTLFLVRALLRRDTQLGSPPRGGYGLSWRDAWRQMWPQTLAGLFAIMFLSLAAPAALVWFMPFLAGLIVAVPFSVAGSSSTLFDWMLRRQLCAIPEDVCVPREIANIRRHGPRAN